MGINFQLLQDTALFQGIGTEELVSMLVCLSAGTRTYEKGQMIYAAGDATARLGVVLSGSVHVIKEDFWGNRSILSENGAGQLFGETYAVLPHEVLEVSVVAAAPSEILFLDAGKIMTPCAAPCAFHARLMRNLLAVTARKNLLLTRKMEYMAQRTTREKLLSYLSAESQRQKTASFEIPFNRQELADYLSVDRSAMSNELGKLRDEGILQFRKNRFTLISTAFR
jgi:CRP-like cAMP-binding protein